MSLSMWFLFIAQIRKNMHKCRKRFLSLLKKNSKRIPSIQFPYTIKRHLCAPSVKASYTIEAAVVLPIFLGLMIFTIFYMRLLQVEFGIQKSLDETGQQIAVVSTGEEDISLAELCVLCDGRILKNKVPVSYIKGGISGISYDNSSVEGNYINLQVSYVIEFPIYFFGNLRWERSQQSIHRKWIGWDSKEEWNYVYVTEHGEVYHLHPQCPYLNPSISAILYTQVENKRNAQGAKYKACRGCGAKKVKKGIVFITEYGEVYHRSLRCVGLKRTIHRIPITQVGERRICGKCK